MPLLAVAIAVILSYQGHVRPLVARDALSGLESANASATALVDAWIDERLSIVGYLAIRPAAVGWDPPGMLEGARRFARSFPELHAIVYADRAGDVVVDSVRGTGGNVADRPYFRSALNGSPTVVTLAQARTSGRPTIVVAQPVLGDGGSVHGVVFAAVEPATLAAVLSAGAGGAGIDSVVVDRTGVIATGADVGSRIDRDNLPHEPIDEPYTDRHGVRVYGVSHTIGQTGWTVVSEVPAASVTATFDRYNRVLAGALVVTLVVAAAMAVAVALSIQLPVRRLERLASQEDPEVVARQNDDARMRVAPVDLRRVYDRMLAMTQTLSKRRQELARSNELLEAAQDIANVGSWEYDRNAHAFTCSEGLLRIAGVPNHDRTMHPSELLALVHPEERARLAERFDASLEQGGTGFELEHRIRLAVTGEVRFLLHRAVHVRDEQGGLVRSLGIAMDITDRHHIEESLRTALDEKSVLLQEVHHRVRNNLAVVEGILSLQLQQVPEQTEAFRMLADARSRITSMALLHRYLYGTEDFTRVEVAEYAHLLLDRLRESYGTPRVQLRESFDDVVLDVNTAIPCGLILNELVVNAYKHAFPGRGGFIDVRVDRLDDGMASITVSDDGVGAPAGPDDRTSGLGTQLTRRLAEQIGATLEYDVADGTRATLRFSPS